MKIFESKKSLTIALIFLLSISVTPKIEKTVTILKGPDAPKVIVSCDHTDTQVNLNFDVEGSVSGGEIAVDFEYPYSEYSQVIPGTSGPINLPILATSHVRGTAYWRDLSGPLAPRESYKTENFGNKLSDEKAGCPTGYLDMWSYILEAWWIFVIAFFVVMSYRFFTGRAMDFQDYFDELRGKK